MGMLDPLGLQRIIANGVEIVRRRYIEYRGSVTVEDDEAGDRTVITLSGEGGPGGGAPLSDVAPTAIQAGLASSAGDVDTASRGNHRHAISVGAPVAIGTTNSQGTGSHLALAKHVHAHGDQGGGTLHAAADSVAAGFMTPSHVTQLQSLADALANVPGTLRLPVPSYMDVTAAPITGTVAKHLFQIPALTVTAADVGRIALDANAEAYLLAGYQVDLEGEVT